MKPWALAGAGLVSLGIAMGIGRFAFTPLLPMMLHDGVVEVGLPVMSTCLNCSSHGDKCGGPKSLTARPSQNGLDW